MEWEEGDGSAELIRRSAVERGASQGSRRYNSKSQAPIGWLMSHIDLPLPNPPDTKSPRIPMAAAPPPPVRVPFVRPALPPYERMQPIYQEILGSGRLTKGPYLQRFEEAVARRLGVRHAVAVSSCTTGLMLVYQALEFSAGRQRAVGEETVGEVIIPSFTFLAGPAALVWNGLRPVFVEVDAASTLVTPRMVADAITPRTVAISACHNFGNPCDVVGLRAIADAHGIPLVIDAAHGFGASQGGVPVGGGAAAQVFSLSPTKLLVAGEGGVVATDSDAVAHLVRLGREYGNDGSYDALFAGVNGRMPEMCAATALVGLELLDGVAAHRRWIAAEYAQRLSRLAGIGFVQQASGAQSSHKDFSITIDPLGFGLSRDRVGHMLALRGIETRAYYSPPCHRQKAVARFHEGRPPLPVTDLLSDHSLSLPIGPQVDGAVIEEVCDAIIESGRHGSRGPAEGRGLRG